MFLVVLIDLMHFHINAFIFTNINTAKDKIYVPIGNNNNMLFPKEHFSQKL